MTDGFQHDAVLGHIDTPNGTAIVPRGSMLVQGWTFSKRSPVSRVDVSLDGQSLGSAGLCRFRPDIAKALANENAELAGFELRTDPHVLDCLRDRALLIARVTLLDGTRHELAPVAIKVAAAASAASPVEPPSRAVTFDPTRQRSIGTAIRLLCFARSLDHGGSQLRMKELIQYLQTSARFKTVVVAPTEGPLRTELEAVGAVVRVTPMPIHSISAYEEQVRQCAAWAAGQFDVVLAFTLTSFFGIDVAERLELPSVWRIGENVPVSRVFEWWGQSLDGDVELRARRAFSSASVVLFISNSTRQSHQQTGSESHFAVLQNGVDVVGADEYVQAVDRWACRKRLHIGNDRRVLICAATLWPIKGQALLISALEHVCADHPQLECVIVGLHAEPYAEVLPRLINRAGLAGCVRLVPFSKDLRPLWRAADVAVCPSESEALSTSVLEAMAFGLPVLASRVGGLPELVEEGVTGWLVEPNDLGSLIAGLKRVAEADPIALQNRGETAMARVARAHDQREALSRIADVISYVARGSRPPWWQETSN